MSRLNPFVQTQFKHIACLTTMRVYCIPKEDYERIAAQFEKDWAEAGDNEEDQEYAITMRAEAIRDYPPACPINDYIQ